MKQNKWLRYFLYFVIILIMVLLRVYITQIAKDYYGENFRMNFVLLLLMIITNVMLGFLLGLEHLVKEVRAEGAWTINLPQLVIIGLPSLYCSIANISIYSSNQLLLNVFTKPLWWLLTSDINILSIFQLIFGYIVVTSFYKEIK